MPNSEAVKIGFETADDKELKGYKVYAVEMWHELHCLVCIILILLGMN